VNSAGSGRRRRPIFGQTSIIVECLRLCIIFPIFFLFLSSWCTCILSFPTRGRVANLKTRLLSDRKDKSGVEIWSRSHGWVMDQKTRMKARSIFEVCCGSHDEDKVARMNL